MIVSFDFKTGRDADLDTALGASRMAFELFDKGTGKYPKERLNRELDRIALQPSFRAGNDISRMSYGILTENLGRSLELAAEILTNPAFSEEEFQKIKDEFRNEVDYIRREPTANGLTLFSRALYATGGPRGRVMTEAMTETISRDDVVAFHEREVTPDNLTIFMLGDVEFEEAKAELERTFGGWRGTGETTLKPVGDARRDTRRVILVHKPNAQQSRIFAGHALPGFDAAEDTRIGLMNTAFGGDFNARVNMNLREEKGWSYGMQSFVSRNPSGQQAIIVSGLVQTDKTSESMVEIMKEYRSLGTTRPVTEAEFELASLKRIREVSGRFATAFDFTNSLLRSAQFGLPLDYESGQAKRVKAVSREAVNEAARSLIDADKLLWVVVGDLEKIEEGVRALDYGPVEVWDPFGKRLR